MSTSEAADPAATGRIRLSAVQPGVEFVVRDSTFAVVASAVESLDVVVPRGLYQIEVRAGDSVRMEVVAVLPGATLDRAGVELPFATIAPVIASSNTTPEYRKAAHDASDRAVDSAKPGHAALVLVVQNAERPGGRAGHDTIELLDASLRPNGAESVGWVPEGRDVTAWSARLPPGGYVLRTQIPGAPGETVDMPMWLSDGWQTVVFLKLGPHRREVSVHLTPAHRPWRADSRAHTAVEIALAGLRHGRAVFRRGVAGAWLTDRDDLDPMIGILAGQSLLIEGKAADVGYDSMVARLGELIPDHPDVQALALARRAAGPAEHAWWWPPMVAAAYRDLLLPADLERPGVLVAGSVAELIAPSLRRTGVWLTWTSMDEHEVAVGTTPSRPATARVEQFIAEVARLAETTALDVAARWRPEHIAEATELPLRLVRAALSVIGRDGLPRDWEMLSPDELRDRCRELRGGRRPADERLVAEIESQVALYRRYLIQPRPQVPPEALLQRLPLMGWLMYEVTLGAVLRVSPAFTSLTGESGDASRAAYDLVVRTADAARSLPWPEFAPRALGAIRACALAESKRDTEPGYDAAWMLHEEARTKLASYVDSHGDDPTRAPYRRALDEVSLQLALAETGTACRTAERVIGRWTDELEATGGEWTADDESVWIQRLFRDLSDAASIGEHALVVAGRIEEEHGFVPAVTEERLALPTSFQNPGIMTARAILLLLAMCPAMERLGRRPLPGSDSWAALRTDLIDRFIRVYRQIDKRLPGVDGMPIPLKPEHARSLVQLRLNLALLVPGQLLPANDPFADCVALDRLDDRAVEAMSEWLAEQPDGQQRGDANVIGSATMPAFIGSVEGCRAPSAPFGGYLAWRRRWFALDRYRGEPGRRERADRILDAIDGSTGELVARPVERPPVHSGWADVTATPPGERQGPVAGAVSAVVQRVLARDDLLRVAIEADEAVTESVRSGDRRSFAALGVAELFPFVFTSHLEAADDRPNRRMHLAQAASILRFCAMAGFPLDTPHRSVDLYTRASRLDETSNAEASETGAGDLSSVISATYQLVRDRRMTGDVPTPRELGITDTYFHGTGGETYREYFHYEYGARLLLDGRADEVPTALGDPAESSRPNRAVEHSGWHRREFILGLAAWESGDSAAAIGRLGAARGHVRTHPGGETLHDISTLSVTLALAEHLATVNGMTGEAVAAAREALDAVERVRGRWRVVAQTRCPLAVALRSVYGDLALLASALPGAAAAEFGLAVALSAKQADFASWFRAGLAGMDERVRDCIDDIIGCEQQLDDRRVANQVIRAKLLRELPFRHDELRDLTSTVVADAIAPGSTEAARVVGLVGDRYALDFVELPDTMTADRWRFRTLIQPGGTVLFDRVLPGDELLPAVLIDRLRRASTAQPIELIVSPDAALRRFAWPALVVEGTGARLIERAIVVQSPVLTWLSDVSAESVRGPAVVGLSTPVVGGLDVEAERKAWSLSGRPEDEVLLSRCEVGRESSPVRLLRTFAELIDDKAEEFRLAHLAVRGTGSGFGQALLLPAPLTAGTALGFTWPASVLMASCRFDEPPSGAEIQPLGFVAALLAAGSRCVVTSTAGAGGTGSVLAANIVAQIRAGDVRLEAALREAQLALSERPEEEWAFIAAHVR